MLTDPHVDAYVEQRIVPQIQVRRLANGSRDYTLYDRRARTYRALAVSAALRALGSRLWRLAHRTAAADAAPKMMDWELRLVEQSETSPALPQKTYRHAA